MKNFSLSEFLHLSAVLNYQLSAKEVSWNNIISVVVGNKISSDAEKKVLIEVLDYLRWVYGQRKRRLGPLSILHPLRATALLVRIYERVSLLDVMTGLLHDNFEDIKPEDFQEANRLLIEAKFQKFLDEIPEVDNWFLMERLGWLTKCPGETYYQYTGRLLNQAYHTPEVVRVKLADRLDNTFDLCIYLEDPLQEVNFFETIFQIMFTPSFKENRSFTGASTIESINEAQRLYQLFKNVVLMSLIRQRKNTLEDKGIQKLIKYLARVSMQEAQRIGLNIIWNVDFPIRILRKLIIESMKYVQRGGIDRVTLPARGYRLDGLFISKFDDPNKDSLRKKLDTLSEDRALILEAALAFIVIFLNFLNIPNYFVRGISEHGVYPVINE